jgi:hypothetical protein
MRHYLLFLLIGLFLQSCKTNKQNVKINRAFYCWKTNQQWFDSQEDSCLQANKINKLYIHFFDVIPSPEYTVGVPDYETNLRLNLDSNYEVIPTIYIVNNLLKNKRLSTLDSMANNIVYLVNDVLKENFNDKTINEIQIDCDWTKSTKENYFYLLKSIKKQSQKQISVTLRLYPYAYPDIMGVPPVDRATLMCYNLVSPFGNEMKNSILDINELKAYLENKPEYAIPLDVGLPIFERYHLYRHGKYIRTFSKIQNYIWKRNNNFWFVCPYSYEDELNHYYFKTGDLIKIEKIDQQTLYKSIEIIKSNVQFSKELNLILFNFDKYQFQKYDKKFYNRFYFHFLN